MKLPSLIFIIALTTTSSLIALTWLFKKPKKQYILGYGSLICPNSRTHTGITGHCVPVRVKGLKRSWSHNVPSHGATVVGVQQKKRTHCNGVLFEVPEYELVKFDAREIGYNRIKINSKSITPLLDYPLPAGDYWVYVPTKPNSATKNCPIIQSYVDVVISGCLQYGYAFTREFITSTHGWQYPWINDRTRPRYVRALRSVPRKALITKLLRKYIGHFAKKKI